MAMDSDVLGSAIAATIIAKSSIAPVGAMTANLVKFWQDVAKDIVDHIQGFAEVPAGIPVSTTGSETAQSGATTSAGTVT
jgi:hypothetical protein